MASVVKSSVLNGDGVRDLIADGSPDSLASYSSGQDITLRWTYRVCDGVGSAIASQNAAYQSAVAAPSAAFNAANDAANPALTAACQKENADKEAAKAQFAMRSRELSQQCNDSLGPMP